MKTLKVGDAPGADRRSEEGAVGRHAQLARIVNIDESGVPRIDYPENPHGPVAARLALPAVDADRLAKAWRDLAVLIVFAAGDSRQPVITGIVRHTFEDVLDETADWEGFRQLTMRAQDELILQCGDAKIVLRRDGRLTILGKEIVSRALQRHRIRGGTVEIN